MKPPLLVQLPLNPSAPFEPTGNVPLAAAALAAAAGLAPGRVLCQGEADRLGDRALAERIASMEPGIVAFTLYCWNSERSCHVASLVRERAPGAVLVAGGPEVSPDNSWLLASDAFDLLVAGEGEPLAERLLSTGPEGVSALRPESGLLDAGVQSFPPGVYPDPWLSGQLDPRRDGSASVETVRGCPSGCIYCSYRRRHPVPRRMDATTALALCRRLTKAGASELVFLDPTFDARPDLVTMLEGLGKLGASCFGEISGESVTDGLARLYASAGFRSVEIGIQSWSVGALRRAGRRGNPEGALDGAQALATAGVKPVIDIILGLPGDTAEGPLEAARQVAARGFDFDAQVFHLSVLPGTELRARSGEMGVSWMEKPPYYVLEAPGMGFGEMRRIREAVAEMFGFDLDIGHRPVLFDGWDGTEEYDLDAEGAPDPASLPDPPSFRHGSLRLASEDLWARRSLVEAHVRRRRAADPFCVLDVVLEPRAPFPLDLLDRVRALEERADYSSRVASMHGTDGSIRPSILLRSIEGFPPGWLREAAASCPLAVDAGDPRDIPRELLEADVGVRLPPGHDLPALSKRVPRTDRVYFLSALEDDLWTSSVLGLWAGF